jgi:hypothetical protein
MTVSSPSHAFRWGRVARGMKEMGP